MFYYGFPGYHGYVHSIGLHILSSDLHIVLNDTCPFNCKNVSLDITPEET